MSKYLVISDIHGNLSALDSVLQAVQHIKLTGVMILGDSIDYGMRSDAVIGTLKELPYPIITNLWGNHEEAIVHGRYERFSGERGKRCAQYTKKTLKPLSWRYLEELSKRGMKEAQIDEKKCLMVHGSLEDPFWVSIRQEDLHGEYSAYDFVLSGHSHCSHYFTRSTTVFVNPGSVGQPRNGNPQAQYALIDFKTLEVQLQAVSYDIELEQSLFTDEVDAYYRIRLKEGR